MIQHRNHFGRMLTKMGLVYEAAEVGVAEGGFSFTLLGEWPGKLHMIDCWQHLPEGYQDGCNSPDEHQEWRYQLVTKEAKKYKDRAIVHRMFSNEAAKLFGAGQLDFIYLDANHRLEMIQSDIRLWYPIVKRGGILAGHDYLDGVVGGSDYGVKQAVDEFAQKNDLKVNVIPEEWPSWWVQKP